MKAIILEFLNDQITEGNSLKPTLSGSGLDTVTGAVQAFEEVKEFIEDLEEVSE